MQWQQKEEDEVALVLVVMLIWVVVVEIQPWEDAVWVVDLMLVQEALKEEILVWEEVAQGQVQILMLEEVDQ